MINDSSNLDGNLHSSELVAYLDGNGLIATINSSNEIVGQLNSNNLVAYIQDSVNLVGVLNIEESGVYPTYSGSYEVVPKVISQKLETKSKLMEDDVNIREIPYFETSNLYGDTVYIGSEVNYGN